MSAVNLAYLIADLLRRYADAALRAQVEQLVRRNAELRAENIHLRADNAITAIELRIGRIRSRTQRRAIRDHQREAAGLKQQLTEAQAQIAALCCELGRRDDVKRDVEVMWNTQAAEDYYAELDKDREGGWL